MKIELIIPDKLSELTLGQYQRFHNIKLQHEAKQIDEVQLKINIISIFCGIAKDNVRRIRGVQVEQMLDIIFPMLSQKQQPLTRRLELDGVQYGFIPMLEEMTFGEYSDADTFIPNWDNMHEVMGVLYRPIDRSHGDTYSIKDYELTDSLQFKQMPLNICFDALFFLTNLGLDLLRGIADYLAVKPLGNQMENLTLERNGVGMEQFIASLGEILDGLKISLAQTSTRA